MKNIFTYMTKDNSFTKKYFILAAIIFLANLLINGSGLFDPSTNDQFKNPVIYYILFVLGCITMLIPYGYSIEVLRTVMNNDGKNLDFPKINPIENFIAGFNVIIAGSLLIITLLLILLILAVINNYTANILHGIITNILNVVFILIFMITSFFAIAMCYNYVEEPSYLNFVNIKKVVKVINEDTTKYFKYYIATVAVTALTYIISFLIAAVMTRIGYIGLILYSMIVSALWTYLIFILAFLFTKAVK